MTNKSIETSFEVLKNPNVEQEIKVLLILEIAYSGDISLAKAKELCTECAIFSDHWVVVDAKATAVVSEVYESKS